LTGGNDQKMPEIIKYPLTKHLEGSGLHVDPNRPGAILLKDLSGHFVAEEKLDGGQVGISFTNDIDPLIQSRGHFVNLYAPEYSGLSTWIDHRFDILFDRLGPRYTMFIEWMFAKRTVFYDLLPSHVMEYDILDGETNRFLDTATRRRFLAGTDIASVPVLYQGAVPDRLDLHRLIRPSVFKSVRWRDNLIAASRSRGVDPETVTAQTDQCDQSEGLYCKTEDQGIVTGRFKYIRPSFINHIISQDSHWQAHRLIPNLTIDPHALS
jgi:hypothetical protein